MARSCAGFWRNLERLSSVAFALLLSSCGRRIGTIGEFQSDAGALEPEAGLGRYIEAESGVLSGGFDIGVDAQASEGRYITANVGTASEDQPGPARASYTFSVDAAGTYFIWGRLRTPSVSHNRFWIQVDGGTWYKWRITTGNTWYWDAFHDNTHYGVPLSWVLEAGPHTLLIANCVDDAWLDRLYYSTIREPPPGNDTPCDPPHTVDLDGGCQPSCGDLGGTMCGGQCSGQPSIPTYDCTLGCCVVSP